MRKRKRERRKDISRQTTVPRSLAVLYYVRLYNPIQFPFTNSLRRTIEKSTCFVERIFILKGIIKQNKLSRLVIKIMVMLIGDQNLNLNEETKLAGKNTALV